MSGMLQALLAAQSDPFYIGFDEAKTDTTTACVVARAATQANDLLIALLSITTNTALTWSSIPAGWTKDVDQGAVPDLAIAHKAAAGSSTSNSFNTSASSTKIAKTLTFRRGAIDVVGAVGTRSGSGVLTAPSITTTAGNGMLLMFCADKGGAGTFSVPAGFQQLDAGSAFNSWAVFYKPITAGATGTVDTTTTSATSTAAVLVALTM